MRSGFSGLGPGVAEVRAKPCSPITCAPPTLRSSAPECARVGLKRARFGHTLIGFRGLLTRSPRRHTDLGWIRSPLTAPRQREREGRPLPDLARDPDSPTVEFDEPA